MTQTSSLQSSMRLDSDPMGVFVFLLITSVVLKPPGRLHAFCRIQVKSDVLY